jgi:monoamine oxidase
MAQRSVDAVVIGAGAAGIAAAQRLREGGRDVVLIEARNRPGGRAFTDVVAGCRFDAGAAYVHFAERNPWTTLAPLLGVDLGSTRNWGGSAPYRDGTMLGPEDARRFAEGRDRFFSLYARHDGSDPDRSLAELVHAEDPWVRATAERFARQAIGEEPERISVADLFSQWDGGDLRVPSGYGTLVARAARDLPIAYGTPARRVRWGGPGAVVETAAGEIAARHVVITVPVGVLKAGRIVFEPALPPHTTAALDGLVMGALSKTVLAFGGERFGLEGRTDAFDLGLGVNFELWPFGQDIVIATFGGDTARDLLGQGEAATVEAILACFAGIVGPAARRALVGSRVADWVHDPWSLGAYSVALPGHAEARAALAEPVGERLYFAGEATSGAAATVGGAMTVGGATIAGWTAADAILARG